LHLIGYLRELHIHKDARFHEHKIREIKVVLCVYVCVCVCVCFYCPNSKRFSISLA